MNRCSISAMTNTLMKYYFYIHHISKNKNKNSEHPALIRVWKKEVPSSISGRAYW